MLTNSQMKADKKEGVGTYCFTQLMRLLALPLLLDKTIAHTKGYVRTHYGLYKPMMWCYCYHLHSREILREFHQ